MTRARAAASLAIATLALAGVAEAGIDAWTTTGPRAAWDMIGGDACRPAPAIVGTTHRWARTDDAGLHWQPLATPPGESTGFSDTDPSTYFIPLATSADRLGGGALYLATASGAILKSVDEGSTWSLRQGRVPLDPVGYVFVPWGQVAHVSRLVVEGERLLVAYGTAGTGGLLRSVDGAGTVTPAQPAGQAVYDVDGRGPAVVAVGGTPGAFPPQPKAWRSDDGGVNWRPNPFAFPSGVMPMRVVMSAGERVVVVATFLREDFSHGARVWASDDGGATYAPLGDPFPDDAGSALVGEQDPAGITLRADGCGSPRVFARVGSSGYVSEDAGTTWRRVPVPVGDRVLTGGWTAPAVAAGAPSLMLATARSGVLRSDDLGRSFIPYNRGLPGAPMTTLGAVFVQGERFQVANASFRWNREGGFHDRFGVDLLRRGGDGNLWRAVTPAGGTPTFALVPGEPGTILAYPRGPSAGVTGHRSPDGGSTWVSYGSRTPMLTERVGGGVEGTGRYFAYGTYVIYNNRPGSFTPATPARSDDAGATWTYAPAEFVDTTALAAAPTASSRVYAGRATLEVSLDAGATWAATPKPAELAADFAPVDGIAVDPVAALHVLVAGRYGNQVFESVDGGDHWARLGAALPAKGLALRVDWQRQPRRVYAGTDDGLFVLEGDGARGTTSWTRVDGTEGLRVAQILVEGPEDRHTLSLATDRGIFEFTTDAAHATVPVHRFYNVDTRTHFYTASVAERDHVLATWPQFRPEGVAFHAVDAARDDVGTPVFRFFNTQTGTHFYTASPEERAHVLATWPQFVEEGVAYRALTGLDAGTVKLFRFFNGATGAHFYTTEDDERAVVGERLPAFVDEGVAYAVYPAVPAP